MVFLHAVIDDGNSYATALVALSPSGEDIYVNRTKHVMYVFSGRSCNVNNCLPLVVVEMPLVVEIGIVGNKPGIGCDGSFVPLPWYLFLHPFNLISGIQGLVHTAVPMFGFHENIIVLQVRYRSYCSKKRKKYRETPRKR